MFLWDAVRILQVMRSCNCLIRFICSLLINNLKGETSYNGICIPKIKFVRFVPFFMIKKCFKKGKKYINNRSTTETSKLLHKPLSTCKQVQVWISNSNHARSCCVNTTFNIQITIRNFIWRRLNSVRQKSLKLDRIQRNFQTFLHLAPRCYQHLPLENFCFSAVSDVKDIFQGENRWTGF